MAENTYRVTLEVDAGWMDFIERHILAVVAEGETATLISSEPSDALKTYSVMVEAPFVTAIPATARNAEEAAAIAVSIAKARGSVSWRRRLPRPDESAYTCEVYLDGALVLTTSPDR